MRTKKSTKQRVYIITTTDRYFWDQLVRSLYSRGQTEQETTLSKVKKILNKKRDKTIYLKYYWRLLILFPLSLLERERALEQVKPIKISVNVENAFKPETWTCFSNNPLKLLKLNNIFPLPESSAHLFTFRLPWATLEFTTAVTKDIALNWNIHETSN